MKIPAIQYSMHLFNLLHECFTCNTYILETYSFQVFFKRVNVQPSNDKDEDIDGAAIDDVDGIPLEELDGMPLDGDPLKDKNDDDLNGAPLKGIVPYGDDIDGEPCMYYSIG